MAFTLVTLTGTVEQSPGVVAPSAIVSMTLSSPITDGTTDVAPQAVTAVCNSSGVFSLGPVQANDDSTTTPTGTFYRVTVSYAGSTLDTFSVVVPHASAPSVGLFSLARLGTLPTPASPFVSSFDGRNGAVTLVAADITGAGGALLASPAFTGTPTAPTATAGTNTTQLATTAFVETAVEPYLPLAGGTMSGPIAMGAQAITGVSDISISGITGATATSRIVGATATAAPVTGTFATGDMITTNSGLIYICTAGGSPGTWTLAQSGTFDPIVSVGTTPPASPAAGQRWVQDIAGGLSIERAYDGSLWTPNTFDLLVMANHPKGYWPMDETVATDPAVDVSGYFGTALRCAGSCPSVPSLVTGNGGRARSLAAAADYFQADTFRTDTGCSTTSGSATVSDAAIQVADQGKPVTGTNIPANSFVGTVTAGTSFLLSSAPGSQINVNATGTATGTATLQIGPSDMGLPATGSTQIMSALCVIQYPSTFSAGTTSCILSRYSGSPGGWILGIDNADHPKVITYGTGSVTTVGNTVLAHSVPHLLTFVYDGTSQFLYVDGVLDSAFPVTGAGIDVAARNFCIGTQAGNVGNSASAFTGYVSKVAFFPSALTPGVCQALYNAFKGN